MAGKVWLADFMWKMNLIQEVAHSSGAGQGYTLLDKRLGEITREFMKRF
jgi:hypothetical protein